VEKKNTIENNSFTVSESNGLIQCKRCRESIKHDAIVCYHCGSMQRPDSWKIASESAKWVGILTALITLIIGLVQINKFYKAWQEKKNAVSELVDATKIQEKASDFENAWYLIREARNIDFASKEAREYEIVLAKKSIRKACDSVSAMIPHLPDYIDAALKALYRGAASKSPKDVADSIAHIGWANWLCSLYFANPRNKGKGRIVDFTSNFKHAIEMDAYNSCAHVGLGYTMLSWSANWEERRKNIDKAMEHFSIALKHSHEREWVRKYQFKGLRATGSIKGKQMILQLSNNIRKNNGELHSGASYYVLEMFRKIWLADADRKNKYEENLSVVLSSLTPIELLATYEWLFKDADFKSKKNVPLGGFNPINHKYITAGILEANDNFESAFKMYSKCLIELDETKPDGLTPDKNYRIYHIEKSYLRMKNFIIDSIERVKRLMSSGQK
jgi:hypothetical protein